VGDRHSEGATLGNLDMDHQDSGRIEQAERAFDQAIAIHRGAGNLRMVGIHPCAAATLMVARGRVGEAHRAWKEGAALLRDARDVKTLQGHTEAMHRACAKAGTSFLDEAVST